MAFREMEAFERRNGYKFDLVLKTRWDLEPLVPFMLPASLYRSTIYTVSHLWVQSEGDFLGTCKSPKHHTHIHTHSQAFINLLLCVPLSFLPTGQRAGSAVMKTGADSYLRAMQIA